MRDTGRTPSIVSAHGYRALSLGDVCRVLGISRRTAMTKLDAGTFPIPALPRRWRERYKFAPQQVDRYFARSVESARRVS